MPAMFDIPSRSGELSKSSVWSWSFSDIRFDLNDSHFPSYFWIFREVELNF